MRASELEQCSLIRGLDPIAPDLANAQPARVPGHGATSRQQLSGSQWPSERLVRVHVDGPHVGPRGQLRQVLGDVDVAKSVETVLRRLAEPIDGLEVLRGLERLFHAEKSLGLQQPELRLVRIPRDEHVEQCRRILELLLLDDATRQPEAPFGVLRLQQERIAVGHLGRLEILLGGVSEAEQAIGVGIAATEFQHARERADRGVVVGVRTLIRPRLRQARRKLGNSPRPCGNWRGLRSICPCWNWMPARVKSSTAEQSASSAS